MNPFRRNRGDNVISPSLCTRVLLCIVLSACGESTAGESLRVTATGLEEARTGIAADTMADGFAVEFDHAYLSVESFVANTRDGQDAALPPVAAVIDLIPQGSEVFFHTGIDPIRWDAAGYTIAPPTADWIGVGVDTAVVDEMAESGDSQRIIGRLLGPDGAVYPFDLGFPVTVRYRECTSGKDGGDGFVVPVGGTAEVELTWHLTHLFFDSFAEDSALRAAAFAATYDGNAPISMDSLRDQPLADLRGPNGEALLDEDGFPLLYIPPSSGAVTLRDHVLAARFGHFDGLEGFCATDVEIAE